MSISNTKSRGLAPRTLTSSRSSSTPWVRNPSWLTLTLPTSSEEKVVGLYAVYPDGPNLVAVNCTGAYTVNWGDGSGNINTASGVTAERNLLYSGAANTSDVGIATAVSVTFEDTGDTITRTSHGFSNNERVAFSVINSTTGISTHTMYYVVNATTNTFQIANTPGSKVPITLTTDGTGSVYRPQYRQVIITITMQSPNTFTDLNLHLRHSQLTASVVSVNWLDLAISGPLLTGIRIGNRNVGLLGTTLVEFKNLEQVQIINSAIRTAAYLFANCTSLQSVPALVFSNMTPKPGAAVTFQDTGDTITLANHGLSNGTPVIFNSITGTTGIWSYSPFFNSSIYFIVSATTNTFRVANSVGGTALTFTNNGSGIASAGVDLSGIFQGCALLKSVPLFDTASVTNMALMFDGCRSLTSVPLFNTASIANMNYMFRFCASLTTVPLFNTVSTISMNNMFTECRSLTSVPFFNTASVKDMSYMFYECRALKPVPLFNTTAVTDMSYMFLNCYSLTSVPLFNTASVTNMSYMLGNCVSLASVPWFNTASVTNMTSMLQAVRLIKTVPLFNTASVTNMSGLFGSCYALETVPLFNTASVTDMNNMFSNCTALTSVPLFNTASVTTIFSMFNGCRSLTSIPRFNTASVTDMGYAFRSCSSLKSVPLMNVSSVNQATTETFLNCSSLVEGALQGTNVSISYANCQLSAAALDRIYASLSASGAGKTITVTGNPGVTGDTPSIATSKGWTVSG